MRNITIRKLPQSRWKEYKELRLEALRSDPIAFGSSYEEEKKLTHTDWKKRMKNVLFAEDEKTIVGMAVYFFQTNRKTRHIAHIFGVYVKKKYRGCGVASALIENALRKIRDNKSIVKINLMVNPAQVDAVRLYEKFGFKKVCTLRKELKIHDKFYDEIAMELFF
jgi:ribosomal protein S18 acetylase RimI-like enzyme